MTEQPQNDAVVVETASTEPQPSPVDNYPERSYEEAVSESVAPLYEHTDQIPDYHEKNPTLKQGPAHSSPPPTQEDLNIPANPGAVVVEANRRETGAPEAEVDTEPVHPLDVDANVNASAPPVVDQADESGKVDGSADTVPPVEDTTEDVSFDPDN